MNFNQQNPNDLALDLYSRFVDSRGGIPTPQTEDEFSKLVPFAGRLIKGQVDLATATKKQIGDAYTQYDKGDSKFSQYADPITKGLASIAFLIDKTSGNPERRRAALEKYGGIISMVESGKKGRAEERQKKLQDRITQIGQMANLDQSAMEALSKGLEFKTEIAKGQEEKKAVELKRQHDIDIINREIKGRKEVAEISSGQSKVNEERAIQGAFDKYADLHKGKSFDEIMKIMPTENPKLFMRMMKSGFKLPTEKERDLVDLIGNDKIINELMQNGDYEGAARLVQEKLALYTYLDALKGKTDLSNFNQPDQTQNSENYLFNTDFAPGLPKSQPENISPFDLESIFRK